MKKVELNHSYFEALPTVIVWDIMLRLPTKACLKCKLVCKGWYGMIVDPEFADMRRSHGFYTTLLLHGIFKDNGRVNNFLLLDLHKQIKVSKRGGLRVSSDTMIGFKTGFQIPLIEEDDMLSLANECNGIMCLKSTISWGPIVICNLLTGESVSVKQPSISGYSDEVYGLGCCPVTYQYKVLRVLSIGHNGRSLAQVQTLGNITGWRTIGSAQGYDDLLHRIPTFLNGSLHWYSYENKCIKSFHFGDEKFWRIELPDEIANHSGVPQVSFCIFNSCLCISYSTQLDQQCNIWVMKEYGVKESWVKQYVFQTVLHYSHRPVMRLQNDNGDSRETLVSCWDNYGLLIADIETGSYTGVSVLGVSSFILSTYDANFSKLHIFSRK